MFFREIMYHVFIVSPFARNIVYSDVFCWLTLMLHHALIVLFFILKWKNKHHVLWIWKSNYVNTCRKMWMLSTPRGLLHIWIYSISWLKSAQLCLMWWKHFRRYYARHPTGHSREVLIQYLKTVYAIPLFTAIKVSLLLLNWLLEF